MANEVISINIGIDLIQMYKLDKTIKYMEMSVHMYREVIKIYKNKIK